MQETVFLLSPAHCGATRARLLLNPQAKSSLALRLREESVELGEVFSFLSGLYFRGKLAYARRFARYSAGRNGVLVITPGRGLVPADQRITLKDLREIASVGVEPQQARYRRPLERDAVALAAELGEGIAVLLGSIATGKYADVLEASLGQRLRFPSEFVGRGDMSRGGLMLRCVSQGRELSYVPIQGTPRRGTRPPKLEPIEY